MDEISKKLDYLISSFNDIRFQNRLILSLLQGFKEEESSESVNTLSTNENKKSVQNAFVSVYQQILYQKLNTPVVICKVQIFNTDGSMVKETRTDPRGKWKMDLPPNKYLVKLVKGATTDKPAINMEYHIVVPDSSVPVELSQVNA